MNRSTAEPGRTVTLPAKPPPGPVRSMPAQVIQVAGVVSYDYLIYPMPLDEHDASFPNESEHIESRSVTQLVIRQGSADLVAQLLTAASPQWQLEVLAPALQPPVSNSLKHNASSLVELWCDRSSDTRTPKFSVTRFRHIGRPPTWHSPLIERATEAKASKVVITGSGEAFKDVEPALDFLQRVRPRYIIHHMTRPLATGRLWDIIRNGPLVRDGLPDPDHLAVVIDADDLRAEGISLSESLSWEATAEDFVRNLGSNGRLDTLVTCPNLFVRFGNQAVIHHRGRDAVNPRLYFYPRQMQVQEDHMIGSSAAFTAGFSIGFPDADLGIRLGMSAAGTLSKLGFVPDEESGAPVYPVKAVMDELSQAKQPSLSTVRVPSAKISSGDSFSVFDALTGDPSEVARQIVTIGPDRALARCPVQQFGKLFSVDRAEQESLGSIVDTMNERLDAGHTIPTCVGVSGPTGSGKKFAAANLAEYVGAERSIRKLTYDTRLMRHEEFVGACHAVRDNAAENHITVISFENFEAVLEDGSTLLPAFLSLMREGHFSDNGHRHTVGRCLLLFLVNQGVPASESAPTPTAREFDAQRSVDHSPLLDNLHGLIQLKGPNQIEAQDRLYSIRRAIMLRHLICSKHPHMERQDGTIKIDDAVLHALLFVPSYKHGLRSLEKLISTSRLSTRNKFDIAALPPEEQIQLHVEGRTFMNYLRSPRLPPTLREKLAEGLFETYKRQRELMCKTDEERKALQSDRAMVDWDELPGELKESTRAQADDIPRKLRAVNCFMLDEERDDPFVHVPAFGEEDLLMLSEMEHERFNAERLQRQWRMGARNSKQRTTPFLVPWRDLTQEWKDVDRVMVECVPEVLARAGYRIYKMKEED